MMIGVDRLSTLLVATVWLGAVTLNGAYVASPPPAENAEHPPARQLGCRCSGCSVPAEETPQDDRQDPVRPLGAPSCPGSCPLCVCASMLTPPTASPVCHRSTYRHLPAADVVTDSGYVRKDIDPPRA